MIIPFISLVAGIILGNYAAGMGWWLIPVAVAVAFCLFMISKASSALFALRFNRLHYIWISLLFVGVGMLTSYSHRPHELSGEELESVSGFVAEVNYVKTFASGDYIEADVDEIVFSSGTTENVSNMRIVMRTDGFSTKKGDVIVVKGKPQLIVDNPNYRSDGYADRMHNKGVIYSCNTTSDNIRIRSFSVSIPSRSSLWRDRIEIAIEKSELDRGTSDFIIAFLLGDKSFVRQDVKDAFSNSGIAHVLALSGMHVGIIMGIFMAILFPLIFLRLNTLRYWIALAAIWAFGFFTGGAPSTIRACVMTTFVVLSFTIQRRRNAGNALMAACFVILLLDPHALFDVGMQLSFLCVACILMFATQFNPINHHMHPRMHFAVGSVLVSMVATFGTWVLVSYYFSRVPLLFLPANLLLLPFLPFYMGAALLYVCLLMLGIDFHLLAVVLDYGYSAIVYMVDFISSFGSATIDFKATLPMVLLWIVGILLLGYAVNRRKRVATVAIGCGFMVCSFLTVPLLESREGDCMIVQRTFRELRLAVYSGDNLSISELPRQSASVFRHGDVELFSIDCLGATDSITSWLSKREADVAATLKKGKQRKMRKYLLLGSGTRDFSISKIPGLDRFDKVILHSSIGKELEKEIIEEARERGLTTIHSLRGDGPLEIKF